MTMLVFGLQASEAFTDSPYVLATPFFRRIAVATVGAVGKSHGNVVARGVKQHNGSVVITRHLIDFAVDEELADFVHLGFRDCQGVVLVEFFGIEQGASTSPPTSAPPILPSR